MKVSYYYNGQLMFKDREVPNSPEVAPVSTWKELHTYKPTGDLDTDNLWLERFSFFVPSVNCQCRNEWKKIIQANPPRWNDWFTWTWEAHNAVNKRIGKAGIRLDEAELAWALTSG